MSLDVSLIDETPTEDQVTWKKQKEESLQLAGSVSKLVEIVEEYYNNRCPENDNRELFTANVTHNLTMMAEEAGIYKHLWRPDEIGITKEKELIEPLNTGIKLLESDPERFKKFEPENKWGTYDGFVQFVTDYSQACVQYPEATISICR